MISKSSPYEHRQEEFGMYEAQQGELVSEEFNHSDYNDKQWIPFPLAIIDNLFYRNQGGNVA